MIEQIISRRLRIALPQVQGTVRLLRDGATIPFISRYRKEATGSLDEVQVGAVKEQLERLTELESRRQTILTTIEEQGKLTPELRRRIEECWDPVELEDLYLPYKPKRRTRATVARERGLEPLADLVMAQRARDAAQQARRYVSAEVPTPEDALAGACDIIAERISENEQARNGLRRTFAREVDFVTAQGNVSEIVTPLCVLTMYQGQLILKSVHPYTTVDEVAENTAFPIRYFSIETTPPPTAEEMRALCAIDPLDLRNIEFR